MAFRSKMPSKQRQTVRRRSQRRKIPVIGFQFREDDVKVKIHALRSSRSSTSSRARLSVCSWSRSKRSSRTTSRAPYRSTSERELKTPSSTSLSRRATSSYGSETRTDCRSLFIPRCTLYDCRDIPGRSLRAASGTGRATGHVQSRRWNVTPSLSCSNAVFSVVTVRSHPGGVEVTTDVSNSESYCPRERDYSNNAASPWIT